MAVQHTYNSITEAPDYETYGVIVLIFGYLFRLYLLPVVYATIDEGIAAAESIVVDEDYSPPSKLEQEAEDTRQYIREMLEWYRDREHVDLNEFEPDEDMLTGVTCMW